MGIPAPVLAASEYELRAVVPFELAGRTSVQVRVEHNGDLTEPLDLTLQEAVPGIFRIGRTNRAAVLNEDGTVSSAANPAKRGSVISFWATGLGSMEPAIRNGSVASSDELSHVVAPLRVTFFDWEGEVLYAGSAPGMVAGVVQVNARVSERFRPFTYPVDLVLSSRDVSLPVRVTLQIE